MKMTTALNLSSILLILCISIQLSFTQLPRKTFSCKNGEYIGSDQFCDGYTQCSDESDEPSELCSSARRVCGPGKFLCPTSLSCVEADLVSDVQILKYCPSHGNDSHSNETSNLLDGIISTVEDIITRDSMRSEGKFQCSAQRCSSVHFLCEGYCECMECSDEISLELSEDGKNEVHKSLSICEQEDQFLCYDNKRCLRLDYVCDGYCNCFDCSDEYGACSKLDHEKISDCPHYYFPTPKGPRCLELFHEATEVIPNQCTSEHICDQTCSVFGNRAICSCYNNGFIKVPIGEYGFRCQDTDSSQNMLMYSTTSQIKLLNLTTGKDTVIKKQLESTILTAAHDYIYYTTYSSSSRSIFKYSVSSQNTTEIELNILLDSPINSIAIDYITDNFYFTTNTTLFVCSNNVKNRTCMQMKCCNVNYVALAPSCGWMFYTRASTGQLIMKSNMDGSDENVLVDGSFRFPTLLAVDEAISKVYWLDSETENRKLLSASFFYGGNNEIRISEYLGNVVSIAALDSRIYFTKARDNQIYILENKENFTKSMGENSKITRYHSNFDFSGLLSPSSNSGERLIEGNLTFSVEQLRAFNPIQQLNLHHHRVNPCAKLKIPCTGLCLLTSTELEYVLGCTCLCNSSTSNSKKNPYWCGSSSSNVPETSSEKSSASVINSGIQAFSSNQSLDQINEKEPEHQSIHPGLLVFGSIIMVALVLSGYFVYRKRKLDRIDFAQRHHYSNAQLNLYDNDDFRVAQM